MAWCTKKIQMISFGLIIHLRIILKPVNKFFQECDICHKPRLDFVRLTSTFCDHFGIIFMMSINHNIQSAPVMILPKDDHFTKLNADIKKSFKNSPQVWDPPLGSTPNEAPM